MTGKGTIEVLSEFADQLCRRGERRLTVYMVTRYETPDGPMHVQEPVVLAPFCRVCGGDEDCDCNVGEA
jgi:hypothetical protein